MPTTKLTNGLIARLKPGPKDQFVWDSQDKGFGVKVSPADKITFIVQKRLTPTTPAIRITIGDHGTFTADEAREVAREHSASSIVTPCAPARPSGSKEVGRW